MMLVMIVSFSISVLGFAILRHELRKFVFNFGLNTLILNFTSVVLIVVTLIVTNFALENPIYLWVTFFLLIICCRFLPYLVRAFFENEMQKESLVFLDKIILSISSGMSLKSSMDRSLEDMNGWRKRQFHDLIRTLNLNQNFSKITSPTLRNLLEEVAYVQSSQIKTLEQLQKLRRNLKMRLDLRHRSRQVALNMNIQAGFLVFVFIGVSFFSYSNYETSLFLKYLFPAVIWFIFGCIGLFYLQRNHKWKI